MIPAKEWKAKLAKYSASLPEDVNDELQTLIADCAKLKKAYADAFDLQMQAAVRWHMLDTGCKEVPLQIRDAWKEAEGKLKVARLAEQKFGAWADTSARRHGAYMYHVASSKKDALHVAWQPAAGQGNLWDYVGPTDGQAWKSTAGSPATADAGRCYIRHNHIHSEDTPVWFKGGKYISTEDTFSGKGTFEGWCSEQGWVAGHGL
jgi:hypothetical protein